MRDDLKAKQPVFNSLLNRQPMKRMNTEVTVLKMNQQPDRTDPSSNRPPIPDAPGFIQLTLPA